MKWVKRSPIAASLLCILAAANYGAQDATQGKEETMAQQSLKVLIIGNSQIGSNNLPGILKSLLDVAPANAPRVKLESVVVNGKGLKGYWEAGEGPGSPRATIRSQQWDYVIIQDIFNVNKKLFEEYATKFDEEIRNAGSRTMLFATANVTESYEKSFKFPDSFRTLNDMQIEFGRKRNIPVAAAGYAWIKYLGPNPTETQILNLYAEDKGHPGYKGSYIYASLLYAHITGLNPELLPLPEDKLELGNGKVITRQEVMGLRKAAWAQYEESVAPRLMAGVAKVEITPPVGIKMSGYAARDIATGIHDPLFARVLVLTDGKTSLALVASDLVWLYSENIVQEARKQWGLDYVVLCGSHTHSGPTAAPGPWNTQMEQKVVAAIGEASRNLFPARIGSGKKYIESVDFGYNRRLVDHNKRVTMRWTNPERAPNGPTDPTVRLLRIDDDTGKTRALAVHYAAHAVVLGERNTFISADYPGATTAYLEQELGGGVTAMFFQGGGGDVHPYECGLNGEYGFAVTQRTGVSLGKNALDIMKNMDAPQTPEKASIRIKESILRIPRGQDKTKIEDVGVMTVLLNDEIALAIISGEPFVQHQLDLAAKSPIKNSFLLGYAYFGTGIPLATYLPSEEATKTGGYGADGGPNNILEFGAGERMIGEAVALIKGLMERTGKP